MKPPRHLLTAWGEVERRLRQTDRVALFTDFDGTLAPIASLADQVRLAPAVRELLDGIAQKGALVGVVSGRKLADLRTRVAVGGIWYVGTHGYFLRRSGGPVLSLLHPTQVGEMAQVHRSLARQLRNVPGIRLEPKKATVAIHYRKAPKRSSQRALATVGAVLNEHPHLHLLSGKKVWELLPDSRVNKWTAIQLVLKLEGWVQKDRQLLFYLGDDATDERVFASMANLATVEGISVAVGKRRDTAAAFFLDSAGEVRRFLEKLYEAVT